MAAFQAHSSRPVHSALSSIVAGEMCAQEGWTHLCGRLAAARVLRRGRRVLDWVQVGPPGGHVVCNLGDVGACLSGRVPDALQQPISTFRKLTKYARCTTP